MLYSWVGKTHFSRVLSNKTEQIPQYFAVFFKMAANAFIFKRSKLSLLSLDLTKTISSFPLVFLRLAKALCLISAPSTGCLHSLVKLIKVYRCDLEVQYSYLKRKGLGTEPICN